jgi:hypothetical protein
VIRRAQEVLGSQHSFETADRGFVEASSAQFERPLPGVSADFE